VESSPEREDFKNPDNTAPSESGAASLFKNELLSVRVTSANPYTRVERDSRYSATDKEACVNMDLIDVTSGTKFHEPDIPTDEALSNSIEETHNETEKIKQAPLAQVNLSHALDQATVEAAKSNIQNT